MPGSSPASSHSSLFSSLRHVFHSSSLQNPSAVAPDPPPPPSSSPPVDQHSLQLFQSFESKLSQRLSSLFPPDNHPCASLSSLNQFLHVLLSTQADLIALVPPHQYPLSQARVGTMTEFLERSVKILDVCRAIKEQIAGVESLQAMQQAVLSSLAAKNGGVLHTAQVIRARKVLSDLILHMVAEGDEEPSLCTNRSFLLRGRSNETGELVREFPVRRRSWHGSNRLSAPSLASNFSDSSLSRQLQEILSATRPPKIPAEDVDDLFCAAMYALNGISIFFLGALFASLPSPDRVHVPSFVPPRSAPWAHPFLRFQDRVQEEVNCRRKKSNGYAGMWELDQIATICRRLLDLTEEHDSAQGGKVRDEIKNLVKQLKRPVEELDKDLGHLYSQLMDFYNSIISSRMDVLDKLSSLCQ